MNGPKRKFDFSGYRDQLKKMANPISLNELPKVKLDLHGAREYAQKKGVAIANLSKEEKNMFVK